MDEEILADQRELVELLESAGWTVTDAELSVYESPWKDDETPEASVTLSARKQYPNEDEGDEDENPFRVR
ncbi:hypothetical protein HAPAU_17290 [Halalkalicoccus paucihalophilus]|uniref:Uncharacterized protein n=1 Tax=Halalkalicoccus paucihalophilus TaxID=1008153 RepID=A0A151AGC1_9EURY|nr:hypothetical protein [Halalkalicoccus paucihalophilus]KYH26630.1 hypothetical protein HAPAU_17290 [Halalkalicoccus paucihalophilus]